MGTRSKTFERGSGHHTGLFEDETCRHRSVLDSSVWLLPSDHVYFYNKGTVIEYRNWHLGLGRRFRSLKLWFVLRSFGVEGFRKHIRRVSFPSIQLAYLLTTSVNFQGVELNNLFATLIRNTDNFSLVTQPSLALTVFRLVPRSEADDQPTLAVESLNDLNRLFYSRISARNDIMMTQTTLNEIFCIRFVTGATRTTEVHVRAAYDIICKEAETTLELWTQSPRDISIKQYPSSQLALVKMTRSRSVSAALQDAYTRQGKVRGLRAYSDLPSPLAVV